MLQTNSNSNKVTGERPRFCRLILDLTRFGILKINNFKIWEQSEATALQLAWLDAHLQESDDEQVRAVPGI